MGKEMGRMEWDIAMLEKAVKKEKELYSLPIRD